MILNERSEPPPERSEGPNASRKASGPTGGAGPPRAKRGSVWFAFIAGIITVTRRPGLLLGIFALTLAVAAPFSVAVAAALGGPIASTPLADPDATRFPSDWWDAFRKQASGPAATFSPAILGFAAPLDNLSAVADRTPRAPAVAAAAAAYAALWPWLWGGTLHRFVHDDRSGVRAFIRDSFARLGPMVIVSAGALAAYAALFVGVYPLLFGPVDDVLSTLAASERDASIGRVVLYGSFALAIATVSLAADLTRIHVVLDPARRTRDAFRAALSFLRRHGGSAAMLAVLNLMLFLVVLAGYAAYDVQVRGVPRALNAIVAGQLYILARLAVRLAAAASQVRLVQRLRASELAA